MTEETKKPAVTKEQKEEIYRLASLGHSAADITEIMNAGLDEADQLKGGTVSYHVGKYRKSQRAEEGSGEEVDTSADWVSRELHEAILAAKVETIKILNDIVDKLLGKSV